MVRTPRALAGCLMLVLAVMLPLGAAALKVAPEVFWFSVFEGDRRIGFGRGEYSADGIRSYAFDYLLVLHLPNLKVGEKSQWRFDEDLRPLSFSRKTLWVQANMSLTNTDEGTFDWKARKLRLHLNEKGEDENLELDLPGQVSSRFTSNLALAHLPLKPGQTFTYNVFSIERRAFVRQTYRVVAAEKAGRYRLEMQSSENPDQLSTFIFETATRTHPNGYVTLSTSTGSRGQKMRQEACSREQAVAGFEAEAESMGI